MVSAQLMEERTATGITAALLGRECWNVACGGSVGATFQLALGGRVARERPLQNPTVSEAYRAFEGEYGLMVWCSWSLTGRKVPITSSDDGSPQMEKGLRGLAGKTIVRADVSQGWYLQVEFSDGTCLRVFPDHVGLGASFDGNWEVWTPDRLYAIGTDLACEIEPRQAPAAVAARWKAKRPSTSTATGRIGRIGAVRIRGRKIRRSGARRANGA
jgi:hypothetical protein